MPPRLSSTRGASAAAKSSTSAIGTSGAPCPPAATSRARKSAHHPHAEPLGEHRRLAQLPGHGGGSCQMVWPGKAMKASVGRRHLRLRRAALHRLRGPLGEPRRAAGRAPRVAPSGRLRSPRGARRRSSAS